MGRTRIIRTPLRKVNLQALVHWTPERLWDLWVRMGGMAVGHSRAQGALKNYVANLATDKAHPGKCYAQIAEGCAARFRTLAAQRPDADVRFYSQRGGEAPDARDSAT